MESGRTQVNALVEAVRAGLAERADGALAQRMRAYMKSEMAFRGVPTPPLRRMTKQVFGRCPLGDRDTWVLAVLTLWREAAYREERYAAVELAGYPAYRKWQAPDLLPMYEEMVVTGAWWDYVDELAIRHVGPLLAANRDELTKVVGAWAKDADRWKRRTSIICQIKAKGDTDVELLVACIEENMTDPDFFLRKGIGWALREYAKTDPEWVRTFVGEHPELSPLSRKEATKHIGAM